MDQAVVERRFPGDQVKYTSELVPSLMARAKSPN